MRNAVRLLVLALIAGPAFSPAQKKDDILEIQRDVADLSEKIRVLQKSQDDKLEALRLLVQQAATASTQVTQDMAALQHSLTTSLTTTLNDEQGKISMAVAPLGSQMDALSQSVNALAQTVSQMNGRMGSLDSRVKDLSDKVSILNQPAAPPPAAAAPAAADPNAAPPGVTRLGLQQDAERDYAVGSYDLAAKEFANYIKYYPLDEYAPIAGYMMGMVYTQEKDYESAVSAFQKVIDTWPANNKSQDALFKKAMALELGGHKKDAIEALNNFIMSYPANDYAPQAKKELAKLQVPSAAKQQGKGKAAVK
jgi:tol-pal system protein YbgF